MEKLPGFHFYPSDKEELIELSLIERRQLMGNQGIFTVWTVDLTNKSERIDLECSLDNARIPTHREPNAVIPSYGNVPFDLRLRLDGMN